MWGLLFLIWLPIEDVDTRYVVPLAAGLCVWFAIRLLAGSERKLGLARFLFIGTLSGLLISPFAVLLIVFKSGLHAHGFPEFTLEQIVDILRSTPLWVLVGGAGGLIAAYFNSKLGNPADDS